MQSRFAAVVLFALALLAPLKSHAQSGVAPLVAPDAARLSLDDIGLYATGYRYRGHPEERFPIGWSGNFEAQTGVALQPSGAQNGRAAFLLHPPWRGGTGTAFQEFRFQLPPAGALQRIVLRGATAMRLDALAALGEKPKSDGATFRVLANGRELLNEARADADWKSFEFDLSNFAGQTLALRFETDAGARDDASFDFALWGNRELVLQGFAPKTTAHPAPLPLDLRRLYSTQNGSVAPPSGFAGTVTTNVNADRAVLTYRGADGVLSYEWMRPRTSQDAPLGIWRLRAQMRGAKTADAIHLASDTRLQWAQTATFQRSRLQTTTGGATCISTYNVNGRTATLRCTARLSGKSLVLDVSCDTPQIAVLEAGRWGPVLRRRAVTTPYYSGQVFYLAHENLFANAFLDWTTSQASTIEYSNAVYNARTDGTRVPLRERIVFSAAWHAAETLPNVPNPPSPFRAHLGGKIVLDVWGGRFDEIARNLQTLHSYGLNSGVVIVHNWQRSGYDNALPAHVPANTDLGGERGMKNLVTTAKRLRFDIALHENYVDYYPNYEGFKADDVSLDSDGHRVTAWYNSGTKVQSFAVQPGAINKLARQQNAQIRARYAPNADYLDVHSAVPPWFHVDYNARHAGAATFRPVWDAHRKLWAFERGSYGGPVLGEGANHWSWSGLLDGVEAQFGAGWPDNQGQSAPLAVDFDLLKMHPLQFNHGMGYYERWWNNATWGALPPMEVLDQYRMQEVIYGHAGFLGGATYSNVPLAWLEHHLMTPVTVRYAAARPATIAYQVNGRWVDGTQAAKAASWNRVRVAYDNGLSVTANNAAQPLREGTFILPQFGWLARGAGVEAWTALRQGVIADYARTANSTFANARRQSDWNGSGVHQVQPSISEFRQTEPRAFALTYDWRIGETLPNNYSCFVHFVGSDDNIGLQNDHDLPRPTSTWKTGETLRDGPHQLRLPDTLPDGEYSVRIGLYGTSGRLSLQGRGDGGNRIQLGTLRVRDNGNTIGFVPEPSASNDRNDIYRHRLNESGKILDFGDVRTNGSVLVRRENAEWVLRVLPRAGDFSLELSAARFGRPISVRCIDGPTSVVATRTRGNWWSITLNGSREYRWK